MSEDIVKVDGPKTCPCFDSASIEEGSLRESNYPREWDWLIADFFKKIWMDRQW